MAQGNRLKLPATLPRARPGEKGRPRPSVPVGPDLVSIQGWLLGYVGSPDFLARYPYYAAVLARMTPVDDPSVAWVAVSWRQGRFYLRVNVGAVLKKPRYLRGLLLHEVHHVVLGHLSHPRFRGAAHPHLMELAMEVSANEMIEEPLPPVPVTCKRLATYGILPGQSTLERYRRLVRAWNREKATSSTDDQPLDDLGRGDWFSSGMAPVSLSWLIEEAVKTAAKRRPISGLAGLVAACEPCEALRELDQSGEPAPFDWKSALQMFETRLRGPVHTFSWPNRRFPEAVGRIPGRRYRVRPGGDMPRILVAIDTSGSMTGDELCEVGRQLVRVARRARVTIVECDAVIHRVYPFDGSLPRVVGGGGTDLRPVFDRQFLRQHRAQGVVYFTDGCGPFPGSAPAAQTLWVLTKSRGFRCPWGQQALLR